MLVTLARALCVASAALMIAQPAASQTVEQFYRGKTVNLLIGFPPGGGFDGLGRLLGRHIGKHIPGNPNVLVQNVPGAASIRLANQLYNVSPKDGTVFGVLSPSAPPRPVWTKEGVQFDSLKFGWLGNLQSWTGIAIAWHTSGVRTLNDVMTKELAVGATGSDALNATMPRLLNNLYGTKFKIVVGYEGSNDMNLAIERGEIGGRVGWCWECVQADRPDWVENKKVNVIIQLGLDRNPALDAMAVPHVLDFARNDEEREIIRLAFGYLAIACPIAAPPGVPADRLAALRQAFEAAARDPELLAEAKRANIDISPTTWQSMQKYYETVFATPPDVVARTTKLMSP